MGVAGYVSVRSFSQSLAGTIERGDLDGALRQIHDFVRRIITEPLCTANVFGSRFLDDLCLQIGRKNWAKVSSDLSSESSTADSPLHVYVVSKLQKSGGHTRVIRDFIHACPDVKHVVLSTEINGNSDRGFLSAALPASANLWLEYADYGSFQSKLTWLQTRLATLRPARVYLFNHHQDSVAVAAVIPELDLDAWYYHHGDHHLCLGVCSPYFKHIDPHPMGYHNCRQAFGIDNRFVPLTTDDLGPPSCGQRFLNNSSLITCTAANSNKIEVPYMVSYLDVIPALLGVTKGRHIHIGRLTPPALRHLRRRLRLAGVANERFVYIPWVPSVWKALHEHQVDLYITSFPYGGGLTLIEAMGAGIPVAVHQHITSAVLGGIDLAYPEAFCWRYPEELFDYCAHLSPQYLEEQSKSGRLQYERFHTRCALEKALQGDTIVPPPPQTRSFEPQSDEWACWMEQQVSLRHIAKRALYRALTRVRATETVRWLFSRS